MKHASGTFYASSRDPIEALQQVKSNAAVFIAGNCKQQRMNTHQEALMPPLLSLAAEGSKRGRLGWLAEDCGLGQMGQHAGVCHSGGYSSQVRDRTCLHSGHSNCFICSQAALVRLMHFGWYLQNHSTGSLLSSVSGKQAACLAQGISPLLAVAAHDHEGVWVVWQFTDAVPAWQRHSSCSMALI